MKDNRLNLLLYRIINGRQLIKYGDLSIFINEPTPQLLLESFELYDSNYEYAYLTGVYTEYEINILLNEYDIWNPLYDKELELIKTEIDNLKIECYENAFDKQSLKECKRKLLSKNQSFTNLLSSKHSMDHLSCDGVAENSRMMWIISHSAFNIDGSKYNWDGKIDLSMALSLYKQNIIDNTELRYIARNEPWRPMWLSAKNGGNLFKKPTTEYTRDQITLCSYSIMYDNIYENPECPTENILNDDDCLDGWMLKTRREREKEKRQGAIQGGIKNEKIRNSKEIMIFAENAEEAKEIYDMNDQWARSVINDRQNIINNSVDKVTDTKFNDVQLELMQRKNEMFNQKFRSK
jgi:hypothetical protein